MLTQAKSHTPMTGQQFQKRIEESAYSQRQLAECWGVSHTTIQRECRREEVRGLYRDAILRVTENGSAKGPSSPVAGSYSGTLLLAQAMYWSNEMRLNADDPWDWGDLPEEVQHTWMQRAEKFAKEHDAL